MKYCQVMERKILKCIYFNKLQNDGLRIKNRKNGVKSYEKERLLNFRCDKLQKYIFLVCKRTDA